MRRTIRFRLPCMSPRDVAPRIGTRYVWTCATSKREIETERQRDEMLARLNRRVVDQTQNAVDGL